MKKHLFQFMLELLESFLTIFLIIISECVLQEFAPVVCHGKGQPVFQRRLGRGINRPGNTHEIEIDDALERREHVVRLLEQPHLGIEAVCPRHLFGEVGQRACECRRHPPEVSREHGVVARRPTVAAVSIVSGREGIHRHAPFREDKILEHLRPGVYLAAERTEGGVVAVHCLIGYALRMEVVYHAVLAVGKPLHVF